MVGMPDPRLPGASICIPTYKRCHLLKRAVASVFAQTFKDWELLISDDEDPSGETWEYLLKLEKTDSRIRVMTNPGEHGQAPNMNRLLVLARAPWVKPLYDDDVLRPDCLETLLLAVRGLPSVALVSCLCDSYSHGKRLRNLRRRGRAELELVPQRYVHLGMYLQDCPCGVPSQVMVKRQAIEKGALFEQVRGIVSSVDAWWNCSVLRHGDLLFVNKVLVEFHQGSHDSITRSVRDTLEEEYAPVLQWELQHIDRALNPPPLPIVMQMVKCVRALHHLRSRRMAEALRLVGQLRHPSAFFLLTRWILNQIFPGRFHVAPRNAVSLRE